MDYLINTFFTSEFFVSSILGHNLAETLTWFIIVYLSATVWEFLRCVAIYASVDEHNVENSIYFSQLLTVSAVAVRPKTIRIVDSVNLVDDAVDQLQRKIGNYPVLGMDCEMKSRYGNSPTIHLLQLATKDGHCVLFRITFLPHIPRSLSSLLSDDSIWKVGVGVYNDALYLLNQFPNQFQIKGTFDLRYLAHHFGISERGLKTLASTLLRASINEHSSEGRWDDIELTPDRIMYAAVDAYLGVLLFHKFYEMYTKKTYGEATVLTEDLLKSFMKKWEHKKSRQFRDDYYSIYNRLDILYQFLVGNLRF